MRGLFLTGLLTVPLCTVGASAAEICRFAGTTDHAGQVAVTTDMADLGVSIAGKGRFTVLTDIGGEAWAEAARGGGVLWHAGRGSRDRS